MVKKWHQLALTKLATLLRTVTSKHNGDFYCLNYVHSFRKEIKLEIIIFGMM